LKTLDGRALIESEDVSENLLALLMRLENRQDAVRKIVRRIARLEESKRCSSIKRLLITCGMRDIAELAIKEVEEVPIGMEVFENDSFFQRLIRESQEKGMAAGEAKGHAEALRSQIDAKFGGVPGWVDVRLASCSDQEVKALLTRILNSGTVEDLFGVR
jgi:hypothetical protein